MKISFEANFLCPTEACHFWFLSLNIFITTSRVHNCWALSQICSSSLLAALQILYYLALVMSQGVFTERLYDELREDVMIWVLETRIFESDQSELQSVVPTLYVVKICGNCILNAKNSKKQFKRPISLFSLCAVESSLLKRPIFDGNSRNENAFFSMFSNSMT